MKLGIGEAIFFAALMLSLLGFVAQYNKGLGESQGMVAAVADQASKMEQRVQALERDLRIMRTDCARP